MKALTLTSLWKLDFNNVEPVDGGFFFKAGDNIVGLPSSLFGRLFWESKAGCAGRECGLEAVLCEVGLRSLGGRDWLIKQRGGALGRRGCGERRARRG